MGEYFLKGLSVTALAIKVTFSEDIRTVLLPSLPEQRIRVGVSIVAAILPPERAEEIILTVLTIMQITIIFLRLSSESL